MTLSPENAFQCRILTQNLLSSTKSLSLNSSPEAPPLAALHLLGNWCRRSWKFTEKEDTAGWQLGHMRCSVAAACGAVGCQLRFIVDNWNPRGRRKYRFETFCYGPLNCKLYMAGPNRKVEGRNGMVFVEEDWVDAMNVEH